MAKTKCRSVRTTKKPGPKTVKVKNHTRSKPSPLKKSVRLIPYETQVIISDWSFFGASNI